jgi:hypothetical protein
MTSPSSPPNGGRGRIVVMVVVLTVGLCWWFLEVSANQRALVRSFGGQQFFQHVRHAERVYVQRVRPRDIYKVTGDPLVDCEPISEEKQVDGITSTRVIDFFTSPSSFYWPEWAHNCLPMYGLRFRFVGQGPDVDVWVCLGCELSAVVVNDQLVGGQMFDPGKAEMTSIAVSLFPDDPAFREGEDVVVPNAK